MKTTILREVKHILKKVIHQIHKDGGDLFFFNMFILISLSSLDLVYV